MMAFIPRSLLSDFRIDSEDTQLSLTIAMDALLAALSLCENASVRSPATFEMSYASSEAILKIRYGIKKWLNAFTMSLIGSRRVAWSMFAS